MGRLRARLGCRAFGVALASAACLFAASAAGAAPADTGTWQDSASTVQASAATTLAFSYTAPAESPSLYLTVTVDPPQDWTATAPATVSCRESACAVTTDSAAQIVVQMNLDVATAFVLDYPATAPGFATTDSFTATEQWGSKPPVTDQLAPLPVTVTCPDDGTGTMIANPIDETAGSNMTLAFTYTAGSCGVGAGGLVAVTVPGGWTQPNTTAGSAGFATWAGGPVSVTGPMIMVPVGQLAPGQQVTFYYETPRAPSSPAGYTFAAAEQSGADGSLQALAASPLVTVTPVSVNPTTPAGGGGGTPTTPAAGGGGTATTPARGGQGSSPTPVGKVVGKVTGAHHATDWLPIILLVIGLILAAGTTGRLAFRGLRQRGGHGATVAADVRAVPRTGPPTTVVIRDTGRRPALTVRIEPHAGAAVTTIEETRP
jgi:hypothetical protein